MGDTINTSDDYSSEMVRLLRGDLKALHRSGCSVVTNGSFARHEASKESDIDFFVLCRDESEGLAGRMHGKVVERIRRHVTKMPSADGAFGKVQTVGSIISSIGGTKDTNERITRRMLYLLEADYLTNENLFEEVREVLIEKYIRKSISDHQLCRFLLNDVIRYYRTICVDFEFKTMESGKAWGTRNIKLVFSRKLMYFSGLLVVADSYQRTPLEKRTRALRLFRMTPIERVREICGEYSEPALRYYRLFLSAMSDTETRKRLDEVTETRKSQTEEFRRLKNDGLHFSLALLNALQKTFPTAHPIHHAIVL